MSQIISTFQVWLEREIFEEEFVQELRDSLDKQKLQAAQNAKIVERFKPSEMTDKIKEMFSLELENEKKLKLLKLVKVDVSSPEAIQQIKGRCRMIGVNETLRQIDEKWLLLLNGKISGCYERGFVGIYGCQGVRSYCFMAYPLHWLAI